MKKTSAIAIIFNSDKTEVLLIKRRDVPIWVLPGGGVDHNESIEQAVAREAFEETGLTVQVLKKIACYTPINRLSNETHVYECKPLKGTPSLGDETADIGYFPLNELPSPFFFIHNDWLNDALKNASHVITKKLDKVTYFNFLRYFLKHPAQTLRFVLSRVGFPINAKE